MDIGQKAPVWVVWFGIFSNLHHFRFSTEQQKINKQEEEVTVAALLKWPFILILRCYYLRI